MIISQHHEIIELSIAISKSRTFARIWLSVKGFDSLIYHDNITIPWYFKHINYNIKIANHKFHSSLVFQGFYFQCKRADELCLEQTAIVKISSAALRISLGEKRLRSKPYRTPEWSHWGALIVNLITLGSSCSLAGAKCIAPLSFRLHQWGREGDPDDWAPQDFHIHCPGLRPGEVTSVPLFTASEPTRETAVTSYKLRSIDVGPGATDCLRRWEGQ